MNTFGEKEAWAYPGTAHFFGYPPLSQELEKLRISNLASTFRGSIRIKAHEKFRRKRIVGVSRDCPIFWVPPIISGTGKATDFKFGRYIQRFHPNKIPLKIFEKRKRGRIQGLPIFSGTPYYLRKGKSYGFQSKTMHLTGDIRTKPLVLVYCILYMSLIMHVKYLNK